MSVSIRRAISATARAQNWKIWHDVQSVSIDLDTRADSAIYRVYRPRRGSHCVIDGAGLFRHPHVQDRLYAAVQVADSRPVWSLGLAGRAVSVAQSDNDLRVSGGVLMLVIENLDGATVERAGALVAREHAAARQVRPELPAAFDSAEVCAAALERLSGGGHHGLVANSSGRTVAVMTATVRENPAVGRYARLPAEGFAVEPDLTDPTGVLAAVFGDLASPLIAGGVRRYYLLHAALPRLSEALSNLGFGRNGAYGIQPAAPRRRSSAVAVHAAGVEDLETVARLALVEIQHRSAPPMFAPRQDRPLADLAAGHRALHDNGAVHLLASLDGRDAGLLTIELTSPVPRLCPDGQPYIGPTATLPAARGQGVGHALVDAALTWAHDHGYQWVSVDFDTANPLSRPFWLNAGFHPAGYGVLRLIDRGAGSTPNAPRSDGGH